MHPTTAPTSGTTVPTPTPLLMIGTPAYGGMVHVDFVNSLLEFARAGIQYSLMTIANESLITRARNTILSAFLQDTKFTHLIFIDGDVRLSVDGLVRLVSSGKDVIGAPVALKGRTATGARIFNIGQPMGESGEYMLNERIGTAALLLTRRAAQALADDAVAQGGAYLRPSTQRGDNVGDLHYDVFRVGVVNDEYLSEDYWVCRRLWQLGFPVHVDPSIITEHNGTVRI